MEVYKVYWWKHNSLNGQYSSAKVHRLLDVKLKPGKEEPKSIKDYDVSCKTCRVWRVKLSKANKHRK